MKVELSKSMVERIRNAISDTQFAFKSNKGDIYICIDTIEVVDIGTKDSRLRFKHKNEIVFEQYLFVSEFDKGCTITIGDLEAAFKVDIGNVTENRKWF